MILVWVALGRMCGKRLKAALSHLMVYMERHGHLDLDAYVTERPPATGKLSGDRSGGTSRAGMGGSSLYSLAATGVCNSWTEALPPLASEQPIVVSGL